MCYDVVVVGAGPAGLVASGLLARNSMKVVLLDRPIFAPFKVGESIPPSINGLLNTLKFEALDAPPHSGIPGSESFWAGEHLQQDFIMQTQGEGWRVDRQQFERDLLKQTLQLGVIHHAVQLRKAQFDGYVWHLEMDDHQYLNSHFVIDASGRGAVLARQLSIPRVKGPPLVALWAVADSAVVSANEYLRLTAQTLVESQLQGWWYAAKLPNRSLLAIFHTSADYAFKICRQPQRWWQQLTTTELISNKFPLAGFANKAVHVNDARDRQLLQVFGSQWAACGDAAICFDPLSSQGIFGAMASAHMLCQCLLASDRKAKLVNYGQQIFEIGSIYRQRRLHFYQRAYSYHQGDFWAEQISVIRN